MGIKFLKQKRFFLTVCMILILSILFAGCNGEDLSLDSIDTDSLLSSLSGLGAVDESVVSVALKSGYFSEEVFKDFEEETGIRVMIDYIDEDGALLKRMQEGSSNYDVVCVDAGYVAALIKSSLLRELNHSKIENEKNYYDYLFAVDGDDNSKYTTPNSNMEYATIIYNTETCPITISSFSDLAKPELKGKLAMTSSPVSLFGMALVSLGYSPSTEKESEIAAAADLLAKIKPNVEIFIDSSGAERILSGEISVLFSWDYESVMSEEENWNKFDIVNLKTGYETYQGFWGIAQNSQRVENAYNFINYMARKEVYVKSLLEKKLTPAMDCTELLPSGFMNNPAFDIDESIKKKAWMYVIDTQNLELISKYYTQVIGGKEIEASAAADTTCEASTSADITNETETASVVS